MSEQRILMGVVGKPHGVRGLVHVHSYAAVPADLARYGVLTDESGAAWTLRWRGQGIAELVDASGGVMKDRDQAAKLANRRLYVERDRLPEPDEDEFYLADLIGLAAIERTTSGERALGTVLAVHDYGAGPSVEIGTRERSVLLPFTRACIPDVEIALGRIVVVMPDEIEVPNEASLEAPVVPEAGSP